VDVPTPDVWTGGSHSRSRPRLGSKSPTFPAAHEGTALIPGPVPVLLITAWDNCTFVE